MIQKIFHILCDIFFRAAHPPPPMPNVFNFFKCYLVLVIEKMLLPINFTEPF